MTPSNIVQSAESAARAAGKTLLDLRGTINPREKAPADLVTEADIASQKLIYERLSADFPNFAFLGEEDIGVGIDDDAEFCWIVDPLDGTTNYVHGLHNFCVSIGLRQNDRIVAGVVYDPNRDEMYSASQGNGAFLDGKKLTVSRASMLSDALVAASFPARVPRDSLEIRRFVEVLVRCQALRRLGSAALNMCFVAAGKLDGYWATSVKKWDVAAGLLIIEEAGGHVTDLYGGPFDLDDPKFVAASTRDLHAELLHAISR